MVVSRCIRRAVMYVLRLPMNVEDKGAEAHRKADVAFAKIDDELREADKLTVELKRLEDSMARPGNPEHKP